MCTKFGVDNFARRLTGAATWRTRRNTTSCPLAPLCENMTLFITPEVHNVLHICHRTEPWPQVKFTENFIRDLDTWFFRYARAQTDNQTDMNSDTLIIILCISGRTKKNEVGGGRHRGAQSAETSTPCIIRGSTTAFGGNPPSLRKFEHCFIPLPRRIDVIISLCRLQR